MSQSIQRLHIPGAWIGSWPPVANADQTSCVSTGSSSTDSDEMDTSRAQPISATRWRLGHKPNLEHGVKHGLQRWQRPSDPQRPACKLFGAKRVGSGDPSATALASCQTQPRHPYRTIQLAAGIGLYRMNRWLLSFHAAFEPAPLLGEMNRVPT